MHGINSRPTLLRLRAVCAATAPARLLFLIELYKLGIVCMILLWACGELWHQVALTALKNWDKFWFNEEVKYNWQAELTGSGNRSLRCSYFIFRFISF